MGAIDYKGGLYHDNIYATGGDVAGTYYSDWIDVSHYNEIEAYVQMSDTANRVDETVDITVEKYAPIGNVTTCTFTQLTADGTERKEDTAYIGGRVRFKIVLAGTFTNFTTRIRTWLYAKRI